jgi:hypothetical protein
MAEPTAGHLPALAPVLAGHDLAVLGAWAVAGLLASVRLFRWEPQPPGHATRPGPDR